MKTRFAIIFALLIAILPIGAVNAQAPTEWRDTRQLSITFTVATENLDGTPLTDLAAVDIFAAQDAAALGDPSIRLLIETLDNAQPGSIITRAVTVPRDGPWYFAAFARDQAGNLGALPVISDIVNIDTAAPAACGKITIN